ncbi:kinase-like domain-containing protein [Mycena belliarum]|uniref:Kinase-like domain-containing protein n=1 Tax=Mycena belliarum TaxID=1033014 RepID=A0AAD6U3P9_9AGAR|nr:kinase-like domain-containing protein [Mycena belliae]
MGKLSTVSCLIYASQYRNTLVQISEDLNVPEHPKLKTALAEDRIELAGILLDVLYSPADEQLVLAQEGNVAQSLLDIIQDTLDHALLHTSESTSKARRLIGKLAKKCDILPSSLHISGVTQRDEHPSFCGGFGDVFKASYQGRPVALKHMRMFLSTDQRDIRRKLCHEALVWQRLRHLYIVPLIGIDTESFPSSLCLVSPWMKNGTVIKYLSTVGKANRQSTINRLICEIAQGLAFLHDQNIIHGDLRGSNILVDDDGHACLTDFGLTVLSDATATQTPNGAGSVPWMAPEMLHPTAFGLVNPARTRASDIYAFGCVCLELFTGHPPFHEAILCDASVMLQVIEGVRPRRPAGGVLPDEVWNIVQKCWAHNFSNRPGIADIVLELAMHGPRPGTFISAQDSVLTVADEDDTWSVSSDAEQKYEGWVASVIAPLKKYIDIRVNPRHHYLDLQEIANGPGGTTLYVARLADAQREALTLPIEVRARDQRDLLAQQPTLVAIKSVPILPAGGSNLKLVEVLRELRSMHDVQCENILKMEALYVDPVEDTLWIRMELMARTLASVIELKTAGLALSDRVIAACTKDILTALEYLRVKDITPRGIRAANVLINKHGVLKLTNLSTVDNLPAAPNILETPSPRTRGMASDMKALGVLVWEMAEGRPPIVRNGHPAPLAASPSCKPAFQAFIRMCFDPTTDSPSGYCGLLGSAFISEACERFSLAQLLVQCTAFEGRRRD